MRDRDDHHGSTRFVDSKEHDEREHGHDRLSVVRVRCPPLTTSGSAAI
jgi:hypothetical protein